MWSVEAYFYSASQISLLGFDCPTKNVVFKDTYDGGVSWQQSQISTSNFGTKIAGGDFLPVINLNGTLFDSLNTTNGNTPANSYLLYRTPQSSIWQSVDIGSLGYLAVPSVNLISPSNGYLLAGTCKTSTVPEPCVGTMSAAFLVHPPTIFNAGTYGGEILDATVGADNCIYAGGNRTNSSGVHDYMVMQSCDAGSTWTQDTTDSATVGQEFFVLKMLSADNNVYFVGMSTVDLKNFYLTFAKRIGAGQWQSENIAGPFVPQQLDINVLASTSACHYDLLYSAEQAPSNPTGFAATLLRTSDCGATWQTANSQSGYILGANLIGTNVLFMTADQKGGYTVTSW